VYAIKVELKLNNSECSLMARHSGYARFCYNLALSIYMGVMDVKVSSSRKLAQIQKLLPTSSKNSQNIYQ
jgi:putative transposase